MSKNVAQKTTATHWLSDEVGSVPLVVVTCRRSSNLRLVVNRRGWVELRLPRRTSMQRGLAFAQRHIDWIRTQMDCMPPACTLTDWLLDGNGITVCGKRWQVNLELNSDCSGVHPDPSRCRLRLKIAADEDRDVCAARLLRWFSVRALPLRLESLAVDHGFRFSRCSVRNQSSRWGSCSTGGTISLNWRLLLLEPALQDYVMLHELCHLREMNHSRRFWGLLERVCPDAMEKDQRLAVEGEAVLALVCDPIPVVS